MNRRNSAVFSAIAAAALTALVMCLLRPAPPTPAVPVSDTLTIEEAARWTYDRDGVWIGELAISADHKGLPITAPGISATVKIGTGDRMIVALHVVLLDGNGDLIAAECLSNPPAGVIEPGEDKTVAVMLQVWSADIARVRRVRLRVTRAMVHRMRDGSAISL